jgi:hypothetical protein
MTKIVKKKCKKEKSWKKLSKRTTFFVKSCHEVVKKLLKSWQKIGKKLLKSCQKVVKSCQ